MAYRAFVSSTFEDLKRHRSHVIRTLRRSGFEVDPMEDWTAATDEPRTFSKARVEGCDLCVLLLARRRGHVPKRSTRSITQMEYEAAVEMRIDVLVFVLADDAPWPDQFDELATDQRLQRWRAELFESRGVQRFGAEPRSLDVAPALTRWVVERQQEDLAAGRKPTGLQWTPRTVRLGRRMGLLAVTPSGVEFSAEVLDSLRRVGDAWIRGKPLEGETRVFADWREYSMMSIVVATTVGIDLSVELQDDVYLECHAHLISDLIDLGVAAGVLTLDGENLRVADDLNEEMAEIFEQPAELAAYLPDSGELKDAVMLAFADMIRVRLLLYEPPRADFAEALGTIVLSTFGFWEGPANAGAVIAKPRPRRKRAPAKSKDDA